MAVEWLERQIYEVEAVRAVYDCPPESRVTLSDAEGAALSIAADVVASAGASSKTDDALNGLQELSFSVTLPIQLNGAPVVLHASLPRGYPIEDGKQARIRASAAGASREDNSRLQRAVNESIDETGAGESVLAAAAAAAAAAEELAAEAAANGTTASSAAAAAKAPLRPQAPDALCRALIWFHHIKSLQKRKDIIAWAGELRLGGFSKPGFPGVLVAEGAEDDVEEYIARLRALRWQAMSVREQEVIPLADGASVDESRALPLEFRELPETELGAACRAAGLERLFLTALKI